MPDRRSALLSFAALALAGCGPGEASQAAALQRFLQTRILDRQGLAGPHPEPNLDARASLGKEDLAALCRGIIADPTLRRILASD